MALRGGQYRLKAKKRVQRKVFGASSRAGARTPKQVMAALGRSRVRPRKK